MISKQEVKHIAKLARLGITEQEEEKFQKEISSILEYVGELDKIDTEGVKPLTGGLDIMSVFREDEAEEESHEESEERMKQAQKLVAAAPDSKDGYVKVKAIL